LSACGSVGLAPPLSNSPTMRSTLCLATLCFAAVGAEPVELTTKNFDKKVVQGKKSAFVKFLAPW